MDLREQKFGIEIEMTGITREDAANVIAEYFGTRSEYSGGTYSAYHVKDNENRTWKLVYDSSITFQKKVGSRKVPADSNYSVELVSPICTYKDIEPIQEIVRKLREKGGFVDASCGIHLHINAEPFEARQLRNLVNIVAAKEDMIYKALQVTRSRENDYCKKIDKDFLERLNKRKPTTRDALKDIWYDGRDGSNQHYHSSRYRCLNLHAVFQKGTIEFRAFNADLNTEKIKAYIQFCMAMTAQAYNQKSASPQKTLSSNEKYTFRVWLLRLGMIGDEFQSARKHLLGHLEGNIAWKSPEQAQAQKERLRAKREKELAEQSQSEEIEPTEIESQEQEETQSPAFVMSM